MSLLQINKKPGTTTSAAMFNLGFRPFFLGASLFAVITITLWAAMYVFHYQLSLNTLSPSQWHAHEMIYGYCMAVIAGFLLTAVMNWTGVQTIHGKKLQGLFILWLLPRLLFLGGTTFLGIIAVLDILFILSLFVAVAHPIIRSRQWKQLGILTKVALFAAGNICFYLGAFGILEHGILWGLYGGFYLIVSLILTIGSRVMPTYIENGVDYKVEVSNPVFFTLFGIFLFLAFFINELFFHDIFWKRYTSFGLFIVYTLRLVLWHRVGIWKKPLLWSLYLSFSLITLGFLLFGLSTTIGISPFLAIHAFAFGGIGLATMGMMGRVTLGHTGRNIRNPGPEVGWALMLLVIGTGFRIGLPLISPHNYVTWVFISQLLWIGAFVLFSLSHTKMLIRPRIDGRPG